MIIRTTKIIKLMLIIPMRKKVMNQMTLQNQQITMIMNPTLQILVNQYQSQHHSILVNNKNNFTNLTK